MAIVQITDYFLNNQKRFSEGAVSTFKAKLDDGNQRLGTGPSYIDPADDYQAYSIPRMSVVPHIYLYVREAFAAGTTVTITTIVDGTVIDTAFALDTVGVFALSSASDTGGALEKGALFNVTDGFNAKFNQTSVDGVVQVIAGYTSVDDKSGKYTAPILA